MKPGLEKAHGVLKSYRGQKLRIWEIQVEGPQVTSWPPAGHQKLYGDLKSDELNRDTVSQRIRTFAETAFRRPITTDELEPIQSLVASKIDMGMSPLAAAQLGFQAILCSPGFLYLDEGQGKLDDYAIASRLSYFLWSSMPDTQLLNLAANGKLRDKAVLREQVGRMIADPKSNRFVSHFIRRWLELDNIGEMPPPPDVPEIEPDIRGATTVRDELAKHRNVATCAECHRKIDPLGFALENFDAIGQWRENYGRNLLIDPSGKFPKGKEFQSFSEFRDQINQRDEQFTKCLTEKLLTYAIGRELNTGDRPAVDAILETLHNQSPGFQELIQLIVESSVFRRN
jgi:hypothetical protein